MRVAWTFWAELLLSGFGLAAGQLCLPDGVAETDLSYLLDPRNASGAGTGTPIRLVVFDWASADVATALTSIFIRDLAMKSACFLYLGPPLRFARSKIIFWLQPHVFQEGSNLNRLYPEVPVRPCLWIVGLL